MDEPLIGQGFSLVMQLRTPAEMEPLLRSLATAKKKINLHWTQSPTAGVTQNGIYRKISGGSYPGTPTATINATTSYNSTGLTSGTTYCYAVTAISAAGESAKSNESCDTAK